MRIMNSLNSEIYKEWTILVIPDENMCSNYSFDIISPADDIQHVSMGGHSALDAFERAKQMIDMEIAMQG